MGIYEIDAGIANVARHDLTDLELDDGIVNVPAFGWGISTTGETYFAPNGADPSEQAHLELDPTTGFLYLASQEVIGASVVQRELLRNPDGRMFEHAPVHAGKRRR